MSAVLIHWLARVTAGWREPNANASSSAAASRLLENSLSVPKSSTAQELQPSFSLGFLFSSKNPCSCPLPGVVPLQSQFKTRKHRAAGSNNPEIWLVQCSHQNGSDWLVTVGRSMSLCWGDNLRLGIYAAVSPLLCGYSQDCQNYLNPSKEITPISRLPFQSCQVNLLTTKQITIGRDLNTLGLMGWDSFR